MEMHIQTEACEFIQIRDLPFLPLNFTPSVEMSSTQFRLLFGVLRVQTRIHNTSVSKRKSCIISLDLDHYDQCLLEWFKIARPRYSERTETGLSKFLPTQAAFKHSNYNNTDDCQSIATQ